MGTEASLVWGTEASLVWGTEAGLVWGTEASLVWGTEAGLVWGTEASLVWGTKEVKQIFWQCVHPCYMSSEPSRVMGFLASPGFQTL